MAILNSVKNLAKIGVQNTKIGTKMAAHSVKNSPKTIANGVKNAPKNIVKSTFVDTKDKEKTLSNFYTGKKLNPKHVMAVGGGYLAINNAKLGFEHKTIEPLRLATMNNYQEMGAPDIMMYDGVGQERAPKNLNADGSIVFGLHNNRRG
ncbi:hypothetical protein COK00_12120 [Bacillus cereus]|uniref:hypothetical protein n=1 Tax=Bacillus cereus TaxID=1396 RepID=UPI000BF432AF|nr:hypothetical protein [Bacillus cereus]PFB64476.1 hypothetical protein CN291_17515 [Bacillus cereus]PFP65336.1 hypothetical protein COK00_12120 [Bacillus cereus]PGT10106.1 hypothetical protein COD03_20240 [Bacillus cereus]